MQSFLVELTLRLQIRERTLCPRILRSSYNLGPRTRGNNISYFDICWQGYNVSGSEKPLWWMAALSHLCCCMAVFSGSVLRGRYCFPSLHTIWPWLSAGLGERLLRQMAQISIHISSSRSHQTQKLTCCLEQSMGAPGEHVWVWPVWHTVFSHRVVIIAVELQIVIEEESLRG